MSSEKTSGWTRAGAANYLLHTSTHFSQRDWNYTRKTKIKHIRYDGDWKGYHSVWSRIKRAFDWGHLTGRDSLASKLGYKWSWGSMVAWIRVSLRTESNLPDGVLDGGNVITYWEETGEYIQVVQPSVGELVANFLLEEPEHPHAVLIADEIARILDGYHARALAGKVSGSIEP